MADNTKQQVDQSFFVFVKDANTGKIKRIAIPADVQIGLQGNPAELQLLGRLSLAATNYDADGVNQGLLYVNSNDTIVSVSVVVTPESGRVTVYLPPNPRNGQLHFIKDMSGTADSIPIDIRPSAGVLIDQYSFRSLTDKYGSIALYWFGDRWRILVAGLGLSSSGAASADATYLTLSGDTSLTNERRLNLSGTNLTLTDQGPNASAVIDLSQILGGGAGTFTYATITADAYGRITAIANGLSPPSVSASYITVNNEPALAGERKLTAGTGISIVDGGANGNITINSTATGGGDNAAAYIVISNTSSLSNERSLVVGSGLRLVDAGSNSTVTLSTPWTESSTIVSTTSSVTLGPGITNFTTTGPFLGPVLLVTSSNQVGVFVDGPAAGAGSGLQLRTTSRTAWELLSTGDTASQGGANKFNIRNVTLVIDCFTILSSGFIGIRNTNPQAALDVNGDINIGGNTRSLFFDGTSGSIRIAKVSNDLKFFDTYNAAGITLSELRGKADVSASYITIGNTGSLPNERALVAGAGISLTDGGAGGTLTITNIGAPGSGADVSASFVTIGNTGSLPNERALAVGTGLSLTDGGAGASVTLDISAFNKFQLTQIPDISASYIVVGTTGSLPNERALVGGVGISIIDGGPNGNITINSTVSGSQTADISASYVVIGNTSSLPNERALAVGTGLSLVDGGANASVTIDISAFNKFQLTQIPDVSASYVVIGNTGSLPNERALVAGTGITITDGGANQTVTISANGAGAAGEVSASYVVLGLTSSLANERVLTAGTGITIVDNGPNNSVVINATGGGGTTIVTGSSIFGQAGYQGFTSSSVFWVATGSWTAFTSALGGNYTDVVGNGIARSGSIFQVLNGGLYYFHSSFNAYGSDAYVSLRLRNTNTNFVALQRTTYRTIVTDQNLVVCEGVVSAAIGDSFQLEYVSSGTLFPWTSTTNTPDGTPMRTGEVSMFLLSTPTSQGTITQTGSFVAPDVSDYLYWPLTDTSGSILNFGTAGALGHMTASSATVKYNQVGPLRNAIAANTNGASLNYLWIVNTATQPTPSSGTFSLSAWFRPENATSNQHQKIVLKSFRNDLSWTSPFIAASIALAGTSDGKMEFGLSGISAGPTLIASGGSCTANDWNHAGITYDGAAMRCYLNGVMIYQTAATGVIDYTSNGWWAIGGNPGNTSEYFLGQVADVRVANVVRPPSYFQRVWNSAAPDASPFFQLTGSSGTPPPIFSTPILNGTVTTNTAHTGSKQSLGMAFFNPQIIQNFGGTSRRYFYRAIVDTTSIETNMSASVDLYDLNAIVRFPPGIITGSIMSSSSGTSTQIQVDLTSVLQGVSGSGIFEARLWRTVSGTLASSAACRNARIDVEFT